MTTLKGRMGNVLNRCGPLSLAALMALLIRSAPADDGEPEQEPKTATVSGRVIDENGGPVAPTQVTVWSFQPQPRRHWEMIAQPEVAPQGAFEVIGLDAPGSYLIRGDVEGLAPGWMRLNLTEGGPAEAEIVVNPAGRVELMVRDADDQPIEGVWLRWMEVSGSNGSVGLGSAVFRDLKLPRPTSDAHGRMIIDDLPRGATLKLGLMHANYAPAEVQAVAIEMQPEPMNVTMPKGIPLTLHVRTPQNTTSINEIEIDLRHEDIRHPSSIVFETLPLDENGVATLMVEAGSYQLLRLTHPEFLIGPALSPRIVDQEYLRIDQKNSVFHFQASSKVEVRGRVVDQTTGEPIAGQWVRGQIPNIGPTGNVPENELPWMHGDSAETDEDGSYSIRLAAGKARIEFLGQGFITEHEFIEFVTAPEGSTEAPLLEMTPIAPVIGQVIGPDGEPAAEAVVRFRGRQLRWVQPVVTDSQGRFTLNTPWIPQDDETEARLFRHPVVAFHPQRPWVGVEWVQLDQPGSLSNVTVLLKEQPGVDLTGLIPGEQTPWERGEWDQSRVEELAEVSLVGQPAPELDGREWLNTPRPQMSLADFRGKYVLLDFWTTWCGPCHADLPSLMLLRQLYGGEHFEIIGVHDNSVTPEKIAAHVQKEGMEFPIVIDHADGRILREYESHGIRGYPSYVLLGPDGRVLIENRTSFGPTLRAYKLELVRKMVLDAEGR